jgi:hypothetical protein
MVRIERDLSDRQVQRMSLTRDERKETDGGKDV